MTSAIPIKQSFNFRLLTKVFYLLGGELHELAISLHLQKYIRYVSKLL